MVKTEKNVAYFSAEIGLSSDIPTYSGGLGVLAGDHIKASADIGLKMVAVTLLYKQGYFKQRINDSGDQVELYPDFDYSTKFEVVSDRVCITLNQRKVWIGIYRYIYIGENNHQVPIYFLDTDIDDNCDDDRNITLRLYSGDSHHRIMQEAVLGLGGMKVLECLGFNAIKTYHMNEGHCSFLTLELLKKYNGDADRVRSSCHFTTHTPVPAGHDQFDISSCRQILGDQLPDSLNLKTLNEKNRLHMTELGLFFSQSANGVSRLHGDVAQDQFPQFNLDYITNGVHHITWMGECFSELFDKKISGWRLEPDQLRNLEQIEDNEIETAHIKQKELLFNETGLKEHMFCKDILTIGFARRSTEYKRARLIFKDIDRLLEIGKNKIQIVFSGKAHPKDFGGKDIIRDIVDVSKRVKDRIKIVFLENYNMRLGRLITSGVDVWLNTPLRPNEASGTSGMKAALNGVPNLSILDGWWAEGCINGENGWSIGSPNHCEDESDADSLYHRLQNDVIPLYYNDKKQWLKIMRCSIETSIDYTAHRMIKEYNQKFYNND